MRLLQTYTYTHTYLDLHTHMHYTRNNLKRGAILHNIHTKHIHIYTNIELHLYTYIYAHQNLKQMSTYSAADLLRHVL